MEDSYCVYFPYICHFLTQYSSYHINGFEQSSVKSATDKNRALKFTMEGALRACDVIRRSPHIPDAAHIIRTDEIDSHIMIFEVLNS